MVTETQIVYCESCGEYLGDSVNGILYKFGQIVTEPHECENQRIAENLKDYWRHLNSGAEV